jgi:hypothetical protein
VYVSYEQYIDADRASFSGYMKEQIVLPLDIIDLLVEEVT